MQSAKDSFYVMLRDRIATINPERTSVVRGVSRPAVVTEENELATMTVGTDTFVLRWGSMAVETSEGLVTMQCEISYATDGTAGNGGMDRGRLLAEMDLELTTALRREPQHTEKVTYTSAGATTLTSNVFWANPVFAKAAVKGERLSRTVAVEVFAYQEAGLR